MTVSDPMGSMRISPVAAPVREQVVMKLHAALQEGRFRPGERLIDREICDLTGASRTSVREALRQLEAEGLLTTVPNRGLVVAVLTAKQASDIYAIRAQLEGLAAQLFTQQADSSSRASLKESLADLKAAYASHDQDRMLSAKRCFYEALLKGTDNEILFDTLNRLYARIHQLRTVSLSRPGRPTQSIAELEELVSAIDRDDAAAAAQIAARHVTAAHEAAVEILSQTTPHST